MVAVPAETGSESLASGKHSKSTFEATARDLFPRGLRVMDVPGDGDCGVHCFIRHGQGYPGDRSQVSRMRSRLSEFLLGLASFDAAWILAFFVIEGIDAPRVPQVAPGNRVVDIFNLSSSDDDL